MTGVNEEAVADTATDLDAMLCVAVNGPVCRVRGLGETPMELTAFR